MGLATYAIVATGTTWGILHDRNVEKANMPTNRPPMKRQCPQDQQPFAKDMKFTSLCQAMKLASATRWAMQIMGPTSDNETTGNLTDAFSQSTESYKHPELAQKLRLVLSGT